MAASELAAWEARTVACGWHIHGCLSLGLPNLVEDGPQQGAEGWDGGAEPYPLSGRANVLPDSGHGTPTLVLGQAPEHRAGLTSGFLEIPVVGRGTGQGGLLVSICPLWLPPALTLSRKFPGT